MKKSIVLLITMLFISAITLLVMDNLKDSEKFINTSSNSSNYTQMNVSVKNINDELVKELNKISKEDLQTAFTKVKLLNAIPLENIKISNLEPKILKQGDYYDIEKNYSNTQDVYLIENIDYRYDLYYLIKDKNITNNRQIQGIVDEYIKISKDDKILKILEDNKFLANYNRYTDSNNTKTFIICNYDLQINNLKAHIDMIFEHKKDIKYFDFYIIGKNID